MDTLTFTVVAVLFFMLLHVPPSLSSRPHAEIGFRAQLIHRDSPLSPFYNPNNTLRDRIVASHRRSNSRLAYLQSRKSRSSSIKVVPNALQWRTVGEYVMSFYVGTPAIQRWAIIDTGSDLTWLQCKPCIGCYKMNQPPYDPSNSSTFEKITCDHPFCNNKDGIRCDGKTKVCRFRQIYLEGSETEGILAYERFIFDEGIGGPYVAHQFIFGCAHEIEGVYDEDESGVVGLDRNPSSFLEQTGTRKFSYCLVPAYEESTLSNIYFGESAQLEGNFTKMLKVKGQEEFYHLSLDGISIGKNRLPIPEGLFHVNESSGGGGSMIDSGTEDTFLAEEGLHALIHALREEIVLFEITDPTNIYNLCYYINSVNELETTPDVTFHFTGADVVLHKRGTYRMVQEDIYCLAMLRSKDNVSLFGNLIQENQVVGYDLDNEVVSFAKADCTKF